MSAIHHDPSKNIITLVKRGHYSQQEPKDPNTPEKLYLLRYTVNDEDRNIIITPVKLEDDDEDKNK